MKDIDILWEKSESVSHSVVSDSLQVHGLKWVAVPFSMVFDSPFIYYINSVQSLSRVRLFATP